jgi:hypothetical protein
MSRKRFLYLCLVLAILFSGVVTPLFQPSVAVGAAPATPTNVSPLDNATVSLTPTLQSSPFDDSGKEPFPCSGVMDSDCRRHCYGPGSRPRDMEVRLFQTVGPNAVMTQMPNG